MSMTMAGIIIDLLNRMDDEKYSAVLNETDVGACRALAIAAVDTAGVIAIPHTTPLVALCDQWTITFKGN